MSHFGIFSKSIRVNFQACDIFLLASLFTLNLLRGVVNELLGIKINGPTVY